MDTVKFDIALSRHPPRCSPTPVAATVPSLSSPETPLHYYGDITSGEPKAQTPTSSLLDSPGIPDQKSTKKEATLGEKFHDWMEMDMEHGL